MSPSDRDAPDKPLFVRLPAREAERLDRAAFEGGVSKRQLITQLVQRYLSAVPLDAEVGDELGNPPAGERGPLVVIGGDEPMVGRHAFRPDPVPDVLTLDQAAAFLQVEPAALADLAERSEVPARRIGDEWRFSRAALLDWLAG
jgi:excisionase family DNA binding protein